MSEPIDHQLAEGNRRAHEGMRAAIRARDTERAAKATWTKEPPLSPPERRRILRAADEAAFEFDRAVLAYEAAQRRAQIEATG